jgi:hypothetical protein
LYIGPFSHSDFILCRAAWYSATTLFFMVYPVLYVIAPEDASAEAAGAAAKGAAAS